jgi:hypothetical protein
MKSTRLSVTQRAFMGEMPQTLVKQGFRLRRKAILYRIRNPFFISHGAA